MGEVRPGEQILVVVSGEVENTASAGPYVAMWAEGYGPDGEQVSWTLDAAHI